VKWWNYELVTLRNDDIGNWLHSELVTLRIGNILSWWHCELVTLWKVTLQTGDLSNNSPAFVWRTVWETVYWLLRFVIEEKREWRIEVTGRRGRRIKHQVDDLKEKRGYCKLKEDAQDRSLFITGCGPVVKSTATWVSAVRDNGRPSGRVLDFMSWSLLWDMRSVRSFSSTLWPTSTVRDNSTYSSDFRHHLFSLCPATCSTLPKAALCTGPVLWKWIVMHLGTYCIGKQDASISQLLTLRGASMSSIHLLCRRKLSRGCLTELLQAFSCSVPATNSTHCSILTFQVDVYKW
jgi:hypothetical protein